MPNSNHGHVCMSTNELPPKVEFDKRTSLGVSTTFPVVVRSGRSLVGSVARDVCARSEYH